MKVRALVLLALAAAISCLAAQPKKATTPAPKPKPAAQAPTSLVLLYTAGADGQIRSCNCTKFRFGGYGREMTLLDSIRSREKDVLLIEGGDVTGGTGFQADLKAHVAAQALQLLGYGAMVLGEKELGVRAVRYVDRFEPRVPLVCANVVKSGESKPVFKPYTILKTAGGLRVAVIGMIDGGLCAPWLATSFGEDTTKPSDVLPALVKEARSKADLVVLAYHGVLDEKSDFAKIQGIDLVLTTHRHSQSRIFPKEDQNTVDAPVGKLGDAVLVHSETSTNWCLGRLDISLAPGRSIKAVKHTLLYLDRAYEEHPAMVKVYDAYNANVEKAVLENAAAFKKGAEALLTKRGLNLTEMRKKLHKTGFATDAGCKDCHPEIHKIWSASRHARAMATLQKTKQEFDPECIRCHATGISHRNGFANVKDTPELANVQCEACHGPVLGHAATPVKGFGKVGEATCRSCHTDERTPDFDFAVAWAKIMH